VLLLTVYRYTVWSVPCTESNHQEFHQIFQQVNEQNKPAGAVVQGPDGGLMYAAV
jgi:hypothetical protein